MMCSSTLKDMHEAHKARRLRMSQPANKPNDPPSPKLAIAPTRTVYMPIFDSPKPVIDEALLIEMYGDDKVDDTSRVFSRASVRHIVSIVANHYGLDPLEIFSFRRSADIVLPRQMAMAVCKDCTILSLPQIGRLFDRDHTTILHALRRIDALCETRPNVRLERDYFRRMFRYVGPVHRYWGC